MALRTDNVPNITLVQVAHEGNPSYSAELTVDSTLDPDAPTLTVADYHFSDITKDATSAGV